MEGPLSALSAAPVPPPVISYSCYFFFLPLTCSSRRCAGRPNTCRGPAAFPSKWLGIEVTLRTSWLFAVAMDPTGLSGWVCPDAKEKTVANTGFLARNLARCWHWISLYAVPESLPGAVDRPWGLVTSVNGGRYSDLADGGYAPRPVHFRSNSCCLAQFPLPIRCLHFAPKKLYICTA